MEAKSYAVTRNVRKGDLEKMQCETNVDCYGQGCEAKGNATARMGPGVPVMTPLVYLVGFGTS